MNTDVRTAILDRVERMPSLSPVATRLVQLLSSPDYNVNEVIDVVRCDAPLTARLLRIVNSPVFGLQLRVDSVDRALIYLGARMVAGIAIGESAPRMFNAKLDGYHGDGGSLWSHLLFTAVATQHLCSYARLDIDPATAFTAGILHDLGKALLSDHLKETGQDLSVLAEDNEIDFLEAERQTLGITHAEAGHLIAQRWGLPASLQEAILHHHYPSQAKEEHQGVAYAVHIGDILAMQWGCGTGNDTLVYAPDAGVEEHFDLTPDTMASILLGAGDEYARLRDAVVGGKA